MNSINSCAVKMQCNCKPNFLFSSEQKISTRRMLRMNSTSSDSVAEVSDSFQTDLTGKVKKSSLTKEAEEFNTTAMEEDPETIQKQLYRKEFKDQIRSWEKIESSFSNFPHYLNENTKSQLLDCAVANIKFPELHKYGGSLPTSSQTLLLSGQQGTEDYQQQLVQALCRQVKADFLLLDAKIFSLESDDRSDSDQKTTEGLLDSLFDIADDDEDDVEEEASEGQGEIEDGEDEDEENDDDEDDDEALGEDEDDGNALDMSGYQDYFGVQSGGNSNGDTSAEKAVHKRIRDAIRARIGRVREEAAHKKPQFFVVDNALHGLNSSAKEEILRVGNRGGPPWFGLQRGDRVKVAGTGKGIGKDWRGTILPDGKHIFIHSSCHVSMWPSNVPKPFYDVYSAGKEEKAEEVPEDYLEEGWKGTVVELLLDQPGKLRVKFDSEDGEEGEDRICSVSDIERETRQWEKSVVCQDALFEFLVEYSEQRPLIVFVTNPSFWMDAVPISKLVPFMSRLEDGLKSLAGCPVMLVGSVISENEDGSRTNNKSLQIIRGRLVWIQGMDEVAAQAAEIDHIFTDVVMIDPPQDKSKIEEWDLMRLQAKENRIRRENVAGVTRVLTRHNLRCLEVPDMPPIKIIPKNIEKLVGTARTLHLARSSEPPTIVDEQLVISPESLKAALELTGIFQETNATTTTIKRPQKDTIKTDEFEKILLSEVTAPEEVGVSFEDIGALDEVKNTLKELVMLPLQRPELFARGALSKPVKGVLLFGPPGTGKTLLAKAVASEAGATFINVSSSVITSKWYGDAEKLTHAVFSLARKMAPTVVFVDEVDSVLGKRGSDFENEASRRMKNEFMSSWDGMKSSDKERVLVLAATNRPYDLDEAVIRRLPRRIMVGLPDAANREKILRIILNKETMEENFSFEELAAMTDGYSGSDLRNLSIAAAYRPIREILQKEKEKAKEDSVHLTEGGSTFPLRPISLEDFRRAMNQVGASVSSDASSINALQRWNEQYGEGGDRKKQQRFIGFVGPD